MNVLIIMHVESEGPGTLGTFLESVGARIHTIRLHAGEALPESADAFHAVVSMGGPMNVYDEDTYPYLKDETDFLHRAVHAGIPCLGVCLGSQMIAKAAGAEVELSVAKEIGWDTVTLTSDGRNDTLFQGLPETIDVLQWHSDMFHVPEGGTLLAGSEICPHQAFRYRNAFGLQFHVEVNEEILSDWFKDSHEVDLSEILRRYASLRNDLQDRAGKIYRNFWSVVEKYDADRRSLPF